MNLSLIFAGSHAIIYKNRKQGIVTADSTLFSGYKYVIIAEETDMGKKSSKSSRLIQGGLAVFTVILVI